MFSWDKASWSDANPFGCRVQYWWLRSRRYFFFLVAVCRYAAAFMQHSNCRYIASETPTRWPNCVGRVDAMPARWLIGTALASGGKAVEVEKSKPRRVEQPTEIRHHVLEQLIAELVIGFAFVA